MNDLDSKLKAVLIKVWYGISKYGQVKDIIQVDDNAIAQIKQAFEEAGYVQMKGTVTGNSTSITYAIKAQSREQWLASQSDMHPEVKA